MKIKNIILIIVIGLLVLFTTQNTSNVQIKLIFFTWNIPLIFLLYIILFGGFFGGYFYASMKDMSKSRIEKKKEKEKKKELEAKEKEKDDQKDIQSLIPPEKEQKKAGFFSKKIKKEK